MKSKGNLMIELIVMIVLALAVVGFVILYFTGNTGRYISQGEIDAQISRCCPKLIEAKNNGGDILAIRCVDDPKLIKMINDINKKKYGNQASKVESPAYLGALTSSGITTWSHIGDVCKINGGN